MKNIVVLKNDAIGDTMQSIPCINKILNIHLNDKIYFFLSNRNKDIYSFFDKKNTERLTFNHKLNVFEKIKIILFFIFKKIEKAYILTPKGLFFYLPFFFRKTKFYAICLNDLNNKFRPSIFLRKYLYHYLINDRTGNRGIKSTKDLQLELVGNEESEKNLINLKKIKEKTNYPIKNDYIFFHLKKDTFDKLDWNFEKIKNFLLIISKKYDVVFTTDIGGNEYTEKFKNTFNLFNHDNNSFLNKGKNITYFHNLSGLELLKLIANSKITIGVHGSFTNFSSYLDIPTIDIFYIKSEKLHDIKAAKDAAREFSPFNKSYFRIVPSKNYDKLLNKIKLFLDKACS